ncbi:MAG: phosphate acyltransferase PlsX [Gammaproteobacteria bacterium]|nr:phosphate acyltransferase PlsX [Gammaproteobacteria bacterium]
MIKVAVDAMGGDFAPKEQVLGAMKAIKETKDIEITLFGNEEEIKKYLTNDERIKIVNTNTVIPMGEHDPVRAIRTMKDSSMVMALDAVKRGECDSICSSGPTQALVVGAHLIINRMKGFKRVALAPVVPSLTTGATIILDCGANIEIKPEYLLQQAKFANVYAKEILGKKDPKIGLLNIGTEESKGREFDKECYALLKDSNLNFIGNVESKDILEPPCDILISDGFTTNMVVKCMEGTAKSMGKMLKKSLKSNIFSMIGALFAKKSLNKFKKDMNPDEIASAMIYGINSPVVKAHGSSNALAFSHGIMLAASVVREDVIGKVSKALEAEEKDE